jgi:aspartate 1-decarboxylase
MQRILLKSKIHRARVTDANIDYEGSISIDSTLMRSANLIEYEQVHVWDVTNGNRLITYAMVGKSGEICMNGAAARLINVGDIIIITAFGVHSRDYFMPKIVHVDENNKEINR